MKKNKSITISTEDLCECGHKRGDHNYIRGCRVCDCKKFKLNKDKKE